MKVYWFKAQAPQRVLALVKHLGLDDVEFEQIDMMGGGLQSPEYVALNPNRKAPTLVDGDRVVLESSAIMAYLCIKAGSEMWPSREPNEQVEVLRWLSWNDCHWSVAVAPFYFEHVVKSTFGLGPPDAELLNGSAAGFKRYAAVLNAHLPGRAYVACDRLTIADFQLASMATYWRESAMPLAEYSEVVRWLDGLNRLPAWADPWPVEEQRTRRS